MPESPWNARTPRRRAPTPLRPQGAKVSQVPAYPPSNPKPRARMRSQPAKLQESHREVEQPASRRTGREKPGKTSATLLVILAVLILAAAGAVISLMNAQHRLDGLVAERRNEEQQRLMAKQAHLGVRANSGFRDLIWKYANEYGISPSFVSAIIKCESSYQPGAVSSVSARGLMQIMPDTGVWLAGRLKINNYSPDLLFDPEFNIRMGTYYLSYLSDMFSGSPVMVAAAYHAGDNNVKHWALTRAADQKTISIDQIPMEKTKD